MAGAIRRPLLGVGALVGISSLAIAGALMVPARQPEVTIAPATSQIAAATTAEPVALVPQPGPPAQPAAELPRSAPSWVAARQPIGLYHLEGPEVDGADFELRVATRGPLARQDILSWTDNADRKRSSARPAAHLVVERYEGETPAIRPLYADLAARAASESIAIDRMSAADTIQSKFGPVEIADAVLSSHRGTLGCLMFRRHDAIGFVIAGWLCGTIERPVDRVALACFLDRVDLVGAGPDNALKRYFAQAERSRKPCAGARQPGRKLSWIDPEAPLPRLKLAVRP